MAVPRSSVVFEDPFVRPKLSTNALVSTDIEPFLPRAMMTLSSTVCCSNTEPETTRLVTFATDKNESQSSLFDARMSVNVTDCMRELLEPSDIKFLNAAEQTIGDESVKFEFVTDTVDAPRTSRKDSERREKLDDSMETVPLNAGTVARKS